MLYPSDDLALPSLWEAFTGRREVDWADREDGHFVDFTPDFARVWQWKDELPEQRLVCAGKHLGGRASLVSLRMLPALYALTGRAGHAEDFRTEELSPVERDVAEAVLEGGPISTAELPELAGHERKRVSAATHRLQRRLILTAAGRQERERGWPAVVLDLLPRRYGHRLHGLPAPEDACSGLAATVLRSASELSAADLAAVIGRPRRDATAALDRLVEEGEARSRDAGGYILWTSA
ncbi:MAG TPA: crosslink repair DNA glycosylase YcaQ family protein [Gaiellaceae bacterium]|nr:crosslink repair DNA glycosylase YcaQ family protein [Gaiellaceae bacterium]